MLGSFISGIGRACGDNGLRSSYGFGRRARVLGPAGFADWALFRLCRGFFHFIITTAVSVRARWKKGEGRRSETVDGVSDADELR